MNSIGKVLGVSFLCLPLGASVTYGTVAGLDLQKAKQQNEDLKQTNITISAENENLKADLEANLAKQEELKAELQTNKDALTLANTRISQIESDLNATNEELSTIKTEKQTLETNITNLRNDLTIANNELSQKQARLSEIENLLAESEENNETLLAEKTTLENEIISVRRQIDNLNFSLENMQAEVNLANGEIARLQNQNATLAQEKTDLQNMTTILNNTITELNAQIEELQSATGLTTYYSQRITVNGLSGSAMEVGKTFYIDLAYDGRIDTDKETAISDKENVKVFLGVKALDYDANKLIRVDTAFRPQLRESVEDENEYALYLGKFNWETVTTNGIETKEVLIYFNLQTHELTLGSWETTAIGSANWGDNFHYTMSNCLAQF